MARCIHNIPTRFVCPDCLAVKRAQDSTPAHLRLRGATHGTDATRHAYQQPTGSRSLDRTCTSRVAADSMTRRYDAGQHAERLTRSLNGSRLARDGIEAHGLRHTRTRNVEPSR